MNTEKFALWLNGWVELNGGGQPTEAQWQMIKEHLALCFNKVTPPLVNNNLEKLLESMNAKKVLPKPNWYDHKEPPEKYFLTNAVGPQPLLPSIPPDPNKTIIC